MHESELYLRIAVALALGLGVGVERGFRARDEVQGERIAGVRTFTILALTGAALGLSIQSLGVAFAAAVAFGLIALLAAAYWRGLDHRDDHGITTEAGAILTFVLGAMAGAGATLAAGLIGVIVITLLHLKQPMHAFLTRVQAFEIDAALKLAIIAIVLLPLLPNQGVGPGQILNPRLLLWAVIVIAGLGFLGYVALKSLGARAGAAVMGLAGGLVSSTGVTISAARLSKEAPLARDHLSGAVAIAQGVMFLRMGALVTTLNAGLLSAVALPLMAGAGIALAAAFWLFRARAKPGESEAAAPPLSPGSPDQLAAALQFVAFVAAVLVLAHEAARTFGAAGFFASVFLSGLVDVDAAIVAVSGLANTDVARETAAWAALGAAAANGVTKTALAWRFSEREFALKISAIMGLSLGGMILTKALVPLLAG